MEDYTWSTEIAHSDNTETMNDYLENRMDCDLFECYFIDGTYAEIMNKNTKQSFGVHASGNGDFFNHKVTFEFIH